MSQPRTAPRVPASETGQGCPVCLHAAHCPLCCTLLPPAPLQALIPGTCTLHLTIRFFPRRPTCTEAGTRTCTRVPGPLPSYLQAVVADDAEEGNDGVQHGQDPQRGLHVAAALLQHVVHGEDAGRATIQAADLGVFP